MKILPNEKRTDEELINQFKAIMDFAILATGKRNISGPVFDQFCRSMFGSSIRSSLQKRFGTANQKEDGFNLMKLRLGYPVLRTRTKEEIIEHYFRVYTSLGKQPTEANIQGSGISINTVYTRFGTHMKALKAMYEVKGINAEPVYPPNIVPRRGERIGENIRHYKLGMIEGAVNEQGVVMMFGKIHQLLGFPEVENSQQEFPDCRATCTRKRGSNIRVNIEFKFLSSGAFKKQRDIDKYKQQKINYLICWENDSSSNSKKLFTAGIEVIALKDELSRLYKEGLIGRNLDDSVLAPSLASYTY